MEQVLTISQSAGLYKQYVERARHLSQISPACKRIILVTLGKDFDQDFPNKDHDAYRVYNNVRKYGHDLLNAEIRIVEDLPPAEWYTHAANDERLACIKLVLKMRDQAKQKGYELTMEPDSFTLKLKCHHIKSKYADDYIDECAGFLASAKPNN